MPFIVRHRPGKQFFITLHLKEIYLEVRADFLEFFEHLDIVTYCVAVEKTVSDIDKFHLHAYLEFSNDYYLADIRDIIESSFVDCNFDLQSCRSKRNCLKYITKEDKNALFNCKESSLNFYLRSILWARRTVQFKYSDPFVVEHSNRYKFLMALHEEIRKEEFLKEDLFHGFVQMTLVYSQWTIDVANWWNDWVVNGFHLRKKQLFLYGPPSVGKSSYIELMLSYVNEMYIYRPCGGRYGFGQLDPEFHKIIIFEEFEESSFDLAYLKRLLEGRPFTIDVKYQPSRTICFKGPIILISNFQIADPALLSRLQVVFADDGFWLSPAADLPKILPTILEVSDSE